MFLKFLMLVISVFAVKCFAIVGGEEVSEEDVMAHSVVAVLGNGQRCTGTVLTKHVILTAAHCIGVAFTGMTVAYGLDATYTSSPREIRKGRFAIYSPMYQPGPTLNAGDLALIRIQGELPEGYYPMKLWPNTVTGDQKLMVAGYGMSTPPEVGPDGRAAGGTIKNQKSVLRMLEVAVENPQFSETEFSVLRRENQMGPCHGDSGGPAFIRVEGVPYLIGATARENDNVGKGLCIQSTIYTRVSSHREWIEKTTEILENMF